MISITNKTMNRLKVHTFLLLLYEYLSMIKYLIVDKTKILRNYKKRTMYFKNTAKYCNFRGSAGTNSGHVISNLA